LPQILLPLGTQIVTTAATPSVGIFWAVSGLLVLDYSAVTAAEHYGDCVTHSAGHYDCWHQWQALGGHVLIAKGYPKCILSTEYDEWPRGRIVYEKPTKRFTLYADRRLQKPSIIGALKLLFGISAAKVIVKSDLHYRTTTPTLDQERLE
jgi:hypothetical protein